MTQQLSPAAQAVLDAADNSIANWPPAKWEEAIAAALRAAADLVAPETYECFTGDIVWDSAMEARSNDIREALFAIATELEKQ